MDPNHYVQRNTTVSKIFIEYIVKYNISTTSVDFSCGRTKLRHFLSYRLTTQGGREESVRCELLVGADEGRKEMFLFNDAHMVKDHSHSERGNPLLPRGLLFLISSYYVVGFEVTLFCWLGSLFVFVDAIVDHLLVDCSEVLPPRYNIQKSQYRVAVCRCFGMMYVIKYLPD